MKHNFPQVDLPVEMLAWRDVTEDILNLYRQSCRLKACIFALCTEGTIKASINLMEYEIKKNDLIILMPGTIIQLNEQKEKVRLCFVGFSAHCVNGINLLQATMGSFSKIWDNPIVNVSDTVASYFVDYFALLTRIQRQAEPVEDDAPAQHLLRAEPDARDPGFGQPVAQAVGVEHAQHDADDQGAEREPSDNGDFGDVKCRERKQRDQENSVQGVRPVTFFQHILAILMTTDNFCFIATAKVASFIGIRNKIWLSGIT